MNKLHEIMRAELAVADATTALKKLCEEYCEETREFANDEIAEKLHGASSPSWITVRVLSAKFYTSPFGIVYTVAEWDADERATIIPLRTHKVSGANLRKR